MLPFFKGFIFGLIFLVFLVSFSPILAADAVAPKAEPLSSSNFNYLINGQTTIGGSMYQWFFCETLGFSILNKCQAFGINAETGQSQSVVMDYNPSGGALGGLSSTIAVLYDNPPTSSQYYLAHMGSDLGLMPKPAYAQNIDGTGSGIIAPIFNMWVVVRNIAYGLFIFIFIAVGFMIMFRQKMNPQTVITVQAALPSLVIGLVLITFSYFIASVIIDFSFFLIRLVAGVFISAALPNSLATKDLNELNTLAQNGNLLELFYRSGLNWNNLTAVYKGTVGQIGATAGGAQPVVGAGLLGSVMGGVLFGIAKLGTPLVLGGGVGAIVIAPLLIFIILTVALLVQTLRLFLALVKAYLEILMFALLGPFYILAGSIPGKTGMINTWWRGILGNSMIFPAVFAGFLFAGLIFGSKDAIGANVPLIGGANPDFIKVIIGYVILLGLPSIPPAVKKAFKVESPQGFAQTAFGGIGTVIGSGQKAANYAMSPLNRQRELFQKKQAEVAISGEPSNAPTLPAASGPANALWRWYVGRR